MNDADYFYQKCREDPRLFVAFNAGVIELREDVMKTLVTKDEHDEMLRTQGTVRGLDRLMARVKSKVKLGIADDESRSGANGHNIS